VVVLIRRYWPSPEKGNEAQLGSRTLDFRFLQGTQALEMHLRFLPSSLLPSFLLRRRFFAGASAGWSAALVSMADVEDAANTKCGVQRRRGALRRVTANSRQQQPSLSSTPLISDQRRAALVV
jgi:hypothetical protein